MGGQRGIYHDGWKAVTNHKSGDRYDDDRWELYNIANDYAEVHDLAADEPERLKRMVDLWWREAEANSVLPLDDRAQARAFARDPATDARRHFVMYPGTRLLTPVTGPNFAMRSFRITAHVDDRKDGDEGVLFAYGRRAAGFALFIQQGKLWFDYNLAGRHTIVSSELATLKDPHTLGCELVTSGKDKAELRLAVDGVTTVRQALPLAFPAGFGLLSSQCGMNEPSPVSARYRAPFRFSGRLDRVEIELGETGDDAVAGLWDAAIRSQ
jgi:arylsulfatase